MDFRRGDRTRTCDSLVPNQERYQLRYTPNSFGYVAVSYTHLTLPTKA